ncbi:MAG: dTDP-4-dehydrorhamnose 3,5-epimerase [Neisseria sp.]|nr:dTDP-4-dehydrorhamnose 3,5-epimerase [Neisseria sp.]
MKIIPTDIPEVKIIQPKVFPDERGFFLETFSLQRYREALNLPDLNFVQDNFAHSKKDVLRGLHYQIENPQGKLIYCLYGEIFDVVVDIRKESCTYGKWIGTTLSAQNQTQLWIPPGFAHGYLTRSETAGVAYKCTDYYNPDTERCIMWNDSELEISWGIDRPLISMKDISRYQSITVADN